jgi:hypothetical protein
MRHKAIINTIREKVNDLSMSPNARRYIGKNPNYVEHRVLKLMRARRGGFAGEQEYVDPALELR